MTPKTVHTYSLISAPKIHTDILWDLTVLFSVVAVVYFFFVFFFRNKFKKDTIQRTTLKNKLAPMVSEFLFYKEQEGTKDEKNSYIQQKVAIRELIKNKTNRDVLSEILLDLKKDVSGATREKLFRLYKELNLEVDAFYKLKSWRWQRISQGMFELTQMQVMEAYVFIRGFINDKRSVIRKQAEISTVTLKPEGISYFLDTTRFQISEWQQLKILEVLSNFENFQPPRFSNWLTAKNKHVVLFALRLIKHYDQSDTEQALISLVRHKNNQIKEEAIQCITKFNFQNARSTLKAIFAKSNTHVKLVILDAIASFQQKEDMLFLEEIAQTDRDFIVKSKALSTINCIVPGCVMPSEDLEEIVKEITLEKKSTSPTAAENKLVALLPEEELHNENAPVEYQENEAFAIDFSNEEITPVPKSHFENYEKTASLHQFLNEPEEPKAQEIKGMEKATEEIIQTAFFSDVIFEAINASDPEKEDQEPMDAPTKESFLCKEEKERLPFIKNFDEVTICYQAQDLSVSDQSIFKSLFEASDDYCKLLLLDEILAVGDVKELAFLQSLHNHHNPEIRLKALLVKTTLQEIISSEFQDIPVSSLENNFKTDLEKATENYSTVNKNFQVENQEKEKESSTLKPLEFCFLWNELEVKPPKPRRFDVFEVEFDIDYSESLAINSDLKNEDDLKVEGSAEFLTPEEHSFFQRLLHFPYKLEDKLNG